MVEPEEYKPSSHVAVFNAILSQFLSPEPEAVDNFSNAIPITFEAFDLLTFPEAFLPADALVDTLNSIAGMESIGCVHVGLRPDGINASHLFSVAQLNALVTSLRGNAQVETADLNDFSDWLSVQGARMHFNVGCLFTIDNTRRLRVCLHPKLVRSVYELSQMPEKHMTEANLLTVVSLRPANRSMLSINIQPLICSDALQIGTDTGGPGPIAALHRHADAFNDLPEHIDIVSIATCTPQVPTSPQDACRRAWHPAFLASFVSAASDDTFGRHRFATFVLSNFRTLAGPLDGGLSGCFLPIARKRQADLPEFVVHSSWGRPKDGQNRWSFDRDEFSSSGWSELGHVISLSPDIQTADQDVRVFGFSIHRMMRDFSRWTGGSGLTDCTLYQRKL